MMWDFASGGDQPHSRHDGHHHPLPPMGMPSPAFPGPAPVSSYGGPSPFSSEVGYTNSYSTVQSSSSYLSIPDPSIPRAASAQGYREHEHHHHHHHRHHRHHSNPNNLVMPGLLGPPQHAPPPHHMPSSHHLLPPPPPPPHSHSSPGASHHVPPIPLPQRIPRPVSDYNLSSGTHPLVKPHRPPQQQAQQVIHQQTHQPVYSTCTGRRKALCIGINYIGHPRALRGCINDARHVREFLIRKWGYKDEDIVILTDDSSNPRKKPTRANMIDAMRWLVKGARANDSLFFHYSGHGGQTRDLDGDELDGFDEVIYPLDFEKHGHITDDVMHNILVKPLPTGCRLTALFDCCHSGTVLDLPYIYQSDGRLKGIQVKQKVLKNKGTSADVITWSGSKDGQTSADTFARGVAVSAMSYAFISSLSSNQKQTYQELLKSVRKILFEKYSQKPQLSSSHHIDTSLRFVM